MMNGPSPLPARKRPWRNWLQGRATATIEFVAECIGDEPRRASALLCLLQYVVVGWMLFVAAWYAARVCGFVG